MAFLWHLRTWQVRLWCFMSFVRSVHAKRKAGAFCLTSLVLHRWKNVGLDSLVNDGGYMIQFFFIIIIILGDKMTQGMHGNSYTWPDPLHSKVSHLYILLEFHCSALLRSYLSPLAKGYICVLNAFLTSCRCFSGMHWRSVIVPQRVRSHLHE